MIPFVETSLAEISRIVSFPKGERPEESLGLNEYFNKEAIKAYSESKAQRRRQIDRVREALEILESLGIKPNGKILDIGCGPGFSMEALEELGDVTGIDVLPDMVEVARKTGHKCILGDIRKDSFNGFDMIFSFSALQWIKDVKAASRNIINSLSPGGVLVIHFYPKSIDELKDWVKWLSKGLDVRIFVTKPNTRKAGIYIVATKQHN